MTTTDERPTSKIEDSTTVTSQELLGQLSLSDGVLAVRADHPGRPAAH